MKKVLLIFLSAALVLSAAGCSGKTEQSYRDAYYAGRVLPSEVSPEKGEKRLEGMADGVLLLPESDDSDPDFLKDTVYAGLFAETQQKVLYLKRPTDKLYPASLTKLMTALLVIEHCRNYDEQVEISEEIMNTGLNVASSLADLQPGCTYSVADLLYGLLIPSGNDAANVLAAHIAGSIPDFVDMMNERAQQLGMFGTHFANPHGLHERNHYTTVYDLYLLMKECLKYPMFIGAAGSQDATVTGHRPDGTTFQQSYRSTNSYLLGYTVPPAGLKVRCAKTGYTGQAGRCLVLVTQDADKNFFISVVAKADTYDNLFLQTNRLLALAAGIDPDAPEETKGNGA